MKLSKSELQAAMSPKDYAAFQARAPGDGVFLRLQDRAGHKTRLILLNEEEVAQLETIIAMPEGQQRDYERNELVLKALKRQK